MSRGALLVVLVLGNDNLSQWCVGACKTPFERNKSSRVLSIVMEGEQRNNLLHSADVCKRPTSANPNFALRKDIEKTMMQNTEGEADRRRPVWTLAECCQLGDTQIDVYRCCPSRCVPISRLAALRTSQLITFVPPPHHRIAAARRPRHQVWAE